MDDGVSAEFSVRSPRRHFGVQSAVGLCRVVAHGHHCGCFQISGVMPPPAFATVKPAILPGSPIFGVPDRSGADVVDAGRIRTCDIPDPAPPFRRATEGFSQRFVAAENIDELRSLFGLSEQDARSIDSYDVLLRNAVSLTAPADAVEKNFASAMQDKSCAGAPPGGAADGRSGHRCRSRRGVSRPATACGRHQVEIRIASPKEYSVQQTPQPEFVQSCLAAMTGRTDIKRIRAINVSVKVLFKDNVGFLAKSALLGKLQSNFGFSFLSGTAQDMSAENVVFAARLGAVRQNNLH
jgi:hypothetical protein